MKIAIIEDDINMRKALETALSVKKYETVSYKNAPEALSKLNDDVDLLVVDINMPKMDGITFLKELDGKYDAIVITGNATLAVAIDALRMGAKDFIRKPFEVDTLIKSIEYTTKLKEKSQRLSTNKQPNKQPSDGFLSTSKSLDEVIKRANKASVTDATILLLGESGVGKEVFAQYIHKNSTRKNSPLVAVNMAAIPVNLLESELFGYEKGAFTDAKEAKAGKFEMADGGTLFLDEIGELPIDLQAKLLRAIQEREIQRLGSSKTIKVDVRIISATNASLNQKIKDKEFREDLYYRLNTIPLLIPPLRDRKEEILPIAANILEKTINKYGLEEKQFAAHTQDALLKYAWPGNIRELISVVERATILSETNKISEDDLFLDGRI